MTTPTCPQRGNRSAGTAREYLQMLLRGHTLQQIGDHYDITHGAVRKALKAKGMPTNSRLLLSAIPTGCTPTDAEVLRQANHALADENAALKARLQKMSDALKGMQ